ncbi:MAG: peptidoglycan-associated lipoprotein Pal [Gammaproteobacteria bacterium]|nr:peptidoglycan-associated lipoprotein Pal [Gammaproteobacteria bacterium]
MRRIHAGLGIMAAALMVLQGCTGGAVRDGADVPVDERSVGADGAAVEPRDGVETGVARVGSGTFDGRPISEVLSDPQSVLSQRVFYFDFNSSELSVTDQEALSAHARLLSQNPEMSVVLEGHADERGSREYNLALGERRAKAIERLLNLQGVGQEQIQVISFGEERPVALGHDEEAWRLNRRVELLYSGY